MKKRILIIILSIAVLLAGIGVFASGLAGNLIGRLTEGTLEAAPPVINEAVLQQQAEDQQRKEAAAQALLTANAGQAEVEQITKFDQMRLVMDATIADPQEYNDLLFNYVYLHDISGFTQEQMDYLSDLVIGGCDMADVIDICYFLADTNEEIQLAGQMYALKGEFGRSRFWIEEAFNQVTENRHGVLEVEDIEEYREQGLTDEDIAIANKLCRQGSLTIQQILKQRLEGKAFDSIYRTIQNMPVLLSSEQASELEGSDVLLCDSIAKLTDEPPGQYLSQAAQGENLNDIYQEAHRTANKAVLTKMRTEELFKPVPEDTEAEQDANGEV